MERVEEAGAGFLWAPLYHPAMKVWAPVRAELGVRYLLWGADEEENIPDSTQPWRESARLIASGPWGELYDINAPPDSPAPAPAAAP